MKQTLDQHIESGSLSSEINSSAKGRGSGWYTRGLFCETMENKDSRQVRGICVEIVERQIADKTKFEEASSTDHRYPVFVLQFSTGRCIPLIPTLQQDTAHLVGHYDMAAH